MILICRKFEKILKNILNFDETDLIKLTKFILRNACWGGLKAHLGGLELLTNFQNIRIIFC